MIQYDGKYMHHAIAIPEGEGRYILDRLTGKIKTIVGPAMYLPDPRTEVVVKRKLTEKECELFYPGNAEVLAYNLGLSEKATEVFEKISKKFMCEYDEAGSIGKRYRREDEIGTPYCITVDFDTLEKGLVTVRHRDSMKQDVVAVEDLKAYFAGKFLGKHKLCPSVSPKKTIEGSIGGVIGSIVCCIIFGYIFKNFLFCSKNPLHSS